MRPRAAPLALLLAACAGGRGARAPTPRLHFPDEVVEVGHEDLSLAGKNDEELFAAGQSALAAGDPRTAAAAFSRIVDLHPGSSHRGAALAGAALAHERLGDFRDALPRYLALAHGSGPEATEADFGAARCHYRLGELAEARDLLDALAARPDLAAADRVRAALERGIVELESGDTERAEASLQLALGGWDRAGAEERVDEALEAKASYWLGEVWRGRFEAMRIDPLAPAEALAERMEAKSQALLAAQRHYQRALRARAPEFATAALARIGGMYDAFATELLEAAVPPGFDGGEARFYRAELWEQVRPAVARAVDAYQETIAAARGLGVEGDHVDRTERALDRLQKLLLADGEVGR